jgi:hypothetical protein
MEGDKEMSEYKRDKIGKILDLCAIEAVPDNIDPWPAIHSKLTAHRKLSVWHRLIPKTRLAWAFLPLILLLVGATVYGATFVVSQLFSKYAGHVEEAGLVQELKLIQTVDGVTVTLERAYADANVVLVGFTVSGPEERYFLSAGKLSTISGQSLPQMFGLGVVPGSDIISGGWRPSERSALIAAFDAASLNGEPSTINLHLETRVNEPPVQGVFQPSTGPFVFDFDVPFNAAKVIGVGQTAEASGATIGLEQVVISPWATRAELTFYSPYDGPNSCVPVVSLQLPSGVSEAESYGHVSNDSSSGYLDYFTGDFTEQHGEWTIVVSELVLPSSADADWTEVEIDGQKVLIGKGSDAERLIGPWVFHFEIP